MRGGIISAHRLAVTGRKSGQKLKSYLEGRCLGGIVLTGLLPDPLIAAFLIQPKTICPGNGTAHSELDPPISFNENPTPRHAHGLI